MDSLEYLKTGAVTMMNLEQLGLIPSTKRINGKRPVVVFECHQEIPCDSCLESCKVGCIEMKNINDIPKVNFESCTGCAACLKKCPGLAAFLVQVIGKKGYVTMQYEFLPLPMKDEKVKTLDRLGREITDGIITNLITPERNDGTAIVTVEIPKEFVMEARAIKPLKEMK
jgi:Fe-S-cluster-containing hydrogenase component 2